LHRPHLLCPAVSGESARPHLGHAQTLGVAGGGSAAGVCGSAAVPAAGPAATAASRGGACGSATPLAQPVVFAQAKHLRAPAGLFFWLLVNWSGGLSVAHVAHRMA